MLFEDHRSVRRFVGLESGFFCFYGNEGKFVRGKVDLRCELRRHATCLQICLRFWCRISIEVSGAIKKLFFFFFTENFEGFSPGINRG